MTGGPHNPGRILLACAIAAAAIAVLVTCSTPPSKPAVATTHATPEPEQDILAAELDRQLAHDVAPLLTTYCFSCHSGDDPKADLPLDRLASVDSAFTSGLDIRLLRDMIVNAEMPPDNKPQPTEHERLILSQWLDSLLAYVPANAPVDPGWFTIHRLNRSEYRATMRDLLGIDPAAFDVAAKLPRDDTGYGFDNIADVLSTSPLAIEQYLDAAERSLEYALGPVVEFGDHPRNLRPLEGSRGQPLPRGGYYLYSNGAATARFAAPLAGDYLIRVKAWETHAGDEHARVSLRTGERRLEQFSVTGTRNAPQDFEVRVRLDAGPQVISAHFINDYYVKDVADRNMGIESISIAGPLEQKRTHRPAQWHVIFDDAANAADESAAARGILKSFASRAYRRPASNDQVSALMAVYDAQRSAGATHEVAVRTGLTAVLVSPHFLFRSVANQSAADPQAIYTLDGYELASRLSYFLWSSMPDRPLLDAAADGSLLTDTGLAAQTSRMLADTRSDAFIDNFAGQWLQLRALNDIAIDRARFPEYDNALRSAMTAEATLFFRDVLRSDRSVLDFVDSNTTFLNARLASHYGVNGVEGDNFRKVELPRDSGRGGVLTMGAVLTLTSNTTRTSPVKRGLFVLDQLLGAPPPPPPADIPPLEQSIEANPNATVRESLAAHVANPTCAACHTRLDPLGLALERYDAIGRLRETDNGVPIDATGTLPGGQRIDGASDVKRAVLDRADQFVEALSAKVLTYAVGRGTEPFDRPAIRAIAQRTRANHDRFSALIESVVLSDTFRTCRGRTIEP